MDEFIIREQQLLAENKIHDCINRMKIEFFQNMSHHLKTPLTVISTSLHNMTDMINFGSIDTGDMLVILENAQSEVMRLSKMLDNTMKSLSLNDSHQKMELIDVNIFLKEIADIHRALLERRFNTLKLEIPASPSFINGNRELLTHVMANLLSNANRYTIGGLILIKSFEENEWVTIIVQDNGSGIRRDILPYIFERGVSDKGTGLGLSICKITVEAHNGVIFVDSSENGTEFTIKLPVYKENA
jgi:signal transduction histidine kinase